MAKLTAQWREQQAEAREAGSGDRGEFEGDLGLRRSRLTVPKVREAIQLIEQDGPDPPPTDDVRVLTGVLSTEPRFPPPPWVPARRGASGASKDFRWDDWEMLLDQGRSS